MGGTEIVLDQCRVEVPVLFMITAGESVSADTSLC
jgi:hypothetical protein